VDEVCQKIRVCEPAFCYRKRRLVGTGVPGIRQLERLVADLALDRSK
jgi:hypothetical protein